MAVCHFFATICSLRGGAFSTASFQRCDVGAIIHTSRFAFERSTRTPAHRSLVRTARALNLPRAGGDSAGLGGMAFALLTVSESASAIPRTTRTNHAPMSAATRCETVAAVSNGGCWPDGDATRMPAGCVVGEGSKTNRPYRSRPLERYPSLRYRSELYERYPLLALTARDVSSGIARNRYHSTYCKQ